MAVDESGPGGTDVSAEVTSNYSDYYGGDNSVGAISMAAAGAPNIVGTGTPGGYLVDSLGRPVMSASYGMRGEYTPPPERMPAETLAKAAAALGVSPEQLRAMASSSELGGARMSATGLDRGTLEMMARAGLGNEPISSTQTVDQALASLKTSEFLDTYAEDIFSAMVPGASTVLGGTKLAAGLMSGNITPGQAITQMAMMGVANQLGIPPAVLNNVLNGDFGKAAANTALGMLSGNIAETTGTSPAVAGLGLQVSGVGNRVGSAISNAIGNQNFNTTGDIAKAIDSGLSNLGISFGGGEGSTQATTGATDMATGSSSSDLLGTIVGIGANLIGTESQADAVSDAAARGGSAAQQAAQINAAAAKEVRELQQQLRAPYTQLGQEATAQYARLLGPEGPLGKPFSMADASNTGAMQQAQRAALEATQQSAAARGGLLTSSTQEGLQRRAADIAAQYQNQAFNQYLAQQQALAQPLQYGMTLGSGQVGAQAGAETEAIRSAGQGSANAILAEAGLLSAADIAKSNMRSQFGTNLIDQLIQAGVLSGLTNPTGTGTAPAATGGGSSFQLPSLNWTPPSYSFVPDVATTPTYSFGSSGGGAYDLYDPNLRLGMGGGSVRLGG